MSARGTLSPIVLTVRNIHTTVSGDSIPYDAIDGVTRFQSEKAKYDWRFKQGRWDGYINLFDQKRLKFPTGLLGRVTSMLTARKVPFTISDKRREPSKWVTEDVNLAGVTLRPAQVDGIQTALRAKRGVFKANTGYGKTVVIAGLIYGFAVPTMIIVPSKDLLYQTAKSVEERLGEVVVGIIGDGVYNPQAVTVSTFQTLAKHLDDPLTREDTIALCKGFDMLIVDEAHHVSSAAAWFSTLQMFPAYYRFGFSATPYKKPAGSELMLISVTGEMIYDYSLMDSVDEGFAVRPYGLIVDYDPVKEMGTGDYRDVYKALIVESDERNQAVAQAALACAASGLPTMVTLDRIAHAEALQKYLPWPFMSGSMPASARKRLRDRVNTGLEPGFISTVGSEGIDVVNLAAIVLAGGGKAEHLTIQRVGRAVRVGKHKYCVIVDFADQGNRMIEAQVRRRLTTYKDLGMSYRYVKKVGDVSSEAKVSNA